MDWQSIINLGVGSTLTVVGWFARQLWQAVSDLKVDLSKLREELPQTYIIKDDYKDDVREIKEMLNRLFDKLDGKVDKSSKWINKGD